MPSSLAYQKKLIGKLHLVQNSVARLLTKTRKREHITPVLATLHWLHICMSDVTGQGVPVLERNS